MELVELAVPVLLKGLWMTLVLTSVSIMIGFSLGLGLALMRRSSVAVISGAARYYSVVMRGTPLMVQLFLIYYGLGQIHFVQKSTILWWVVGEGTHCAVLALALNTAAYTSEILRGSFESLPPGLVEAAKACGMSRLKRLQRIEFPFAIRQALPAYGNEIVLQVKGTSLASTITVLEITGYAKRLMSQTFAIFEVFTLAGILYLAINLLLIGGVRILERRLMRHTAPISNAGSAIPEPTR